MSRRVAGQVSNWDTTINPFKLFAYNAVGDYLGPPLATAYTTNAIGGSTAVSNRFIRFTPIVVVRKTTVDEIAVIITTAATDSGTNVELGYCQSDINGLPNLSTVVVLGTADATTPGEKKIAISPAITLEPGLYYTIINLIGNTTATGTNPVFAANSGPTFIPTISGSNIGSNNSTTAYFWGQKAASFVANLSMTSVTSVSPNYGNGLPLIRNILKVSALS
jgi:hypothetical protein